MVANAPSGSESYMAIVSSTTPLTTDSDVGGRERLTPRSSNISYVSGYRQTGMSEPVTYRSLGSLHCISCNAVPALYCSNGDGCRTSSMASDKAYAGNADTSVIMDNTPRRKRYCFIL